MEVRQTLQPGQRGTRKLLARFGERLVCVRYRYDAASGTRLTTVELIVGTARWTPRQRTPTAPDDRIFHVRVGYRELELRERVKAEGGLWRPDLKLWAIRGSAVRRLGLEDRVSLLRTPASSGASRLQK